MICFDIPNAKAGSEAIKSTYDSQDSLLDQSFKKLLDEVTYNLQLEQDNSILILQSLELLKDESISTKEELYYLQKELEIR
jgi:hypothetical protein